jgi:outer membrane receptor protein involved in Fe transport
MRFVAKAAGAPAARGLLAGASLAVLAFAATPALAEDAAADAPAADDPPQASTPAPADSGSAASDKEILVTGSRVVTNGMNSPVPVTAVPAEELQAMDPSSLIQSVSQLPQFYGNTTPQSSNFFVRGGTGNLNLRGLGPNRTLTLLNSRRVPGNSAFGGVDINLFPEALISGIETVTGGASAQYGTDAVAGVVNFRLNTDFTGLQVDLQGGFTDRDDGYNYDAKVAWGVDIGDRAHLLLAGSKASTDGIHTLRKRGWYNSTGAIQVNGVWTDFPDVRSIGGSFDGIIFSTTDVNPNTPGTQNPINGLQFDRNGNYSPLVLGSVSQGAVGNGGRTAGGSGDDLNSEIYTLYPDTDRYSLFAYGDYNVSDNFTVFAQYMRGYNHQFQYNNPRGSLLGQPTAITIFQDNAFLPDSLRQIMIANNIPSFSLRRVGSIEDIGNVWFADRITQDIGTAGFHADIGGDGFLEGWNVDGYYQYGHSRRVWDQYTMRVDRIFAAVDAVRDANGNIVCRVSTFSGGAAAFPGCQPLNLFGRGNASPEAIDYVLGNDVGVHVDTPLYFANLGYTGETLSYDSVAPKRNITTFNQHFAEVSAHGNLVDLWAGPISLAVGASYREESIYQVVQDTANQASDFSGAFHPVMCNNPAIGLRGVNPPDCNNTVAFQFSKVSNIQGKANVKEAFGETYIPLLDNPNGLSANIDLAARWADYSGSGTIWAYKGGMQIGVADFLRFRGTYSRDVRAGNLSERFDKTGGAGNVTDTRITDADVAACQALKNPTLVCAKSYTVTVFSGGNPNIKPEKADTYTLGAVITPPFLPGFSASVDWYKINITGAIATVGTNEVARRCLEDNEQQFCDLIEFSGTTDAGGYPKMILVGNQYVNVAASRVEGIDAEIGYHTNIKMFGGGAESLSGRLFLSWLIDRSDVGATGVTTQFDGLTGLAPDTGAPGLFPHFKATGNINYNNGPFSLFFQGRLIGKGKRAWQIGGVDAEEGVNIADNSVPSVFYADVRLAYDFTLGDHSVELWGSVTNLFDKSPPVTGTFSSFTGASTQYNGSLFDILGRRYTVGVKFKL